MESWHAKLQLAGLLMVLAAGVCLLIARADARRDEELRSWPTVEATIDSSTIGRTTEARAGSTIHRSRQPMNSPVEMVPVWAIQLTYRYAINGTEYVGDRATSSNVNEEVRLHPDRPSARLQALQRRLPSGGSVPVHVHPHDPQASYALYVDNAGVKRLFSAGIALALVGLGLGVLPTIVSRLR